MEDVRKYEKALHEETNIKVITSNAKSDSEPISPVKSWFDWS